MEIHPVMLDESSLFALQWMWVLTGYFLGSIPCAWLVTKWVSGKDLRQLGSGNLGVMNTAISSSRYAGMVVFLAEISKGALAVIIPRFFNAGDLILGLSVLAVVMGTRRSVWMGFRGGRGNTAGMAALALISWQSVVMLLALWLLINFLNKNTFITTRVTLWLIPIVVYSVTQSAGWATLAMSLSLVYLSTHREETDDHLLLIGKWGSFWAYLLFPLTHIGSERS